MRQLVLSLLALGLVAAAPARTQTYVTGQVIDPADVTENEDNIFQYLQAGVDTYRTGTITATALASGAVTSAAITDGTIATADVADNSVTGGKLAMGSDAQGDVLYYNGTDWARLGAGTLGQVLQTQGASANPTWAAPVRVAIGSFTRDTAAASGSVAYTGIGFQPSVVMFFASTETADEEMSIGVDRASTEMVLYDGNAAGSDWSVTTGQSIQLEETPTSRQVGNIASLDSDGFTMSWTLAGSPTGTATVTYWAVD